MFDFDRWQEIFSTIKKNKLRTFLTALGVWWGIFMLIVLMGAGTGLENGVWGLFGSQAKNALYVWPRRTTLPYEGLPPGRRVRFTSMDIQALQDHFPEEIEYMAPRLWVPSGEITYLGHKGSFDVRGEGPDLLHIDPIEISGGRFLNELDIEKKRKVVVLGKRVREQLFEDEDPIGKYIKISGAQYLIIGLFQSNRRGSEGEDDEKTIFMPLTTAQRATNRPHDIGWFVCTINKKYNVAEKEKEIIALLKKRHRIDPDDPQGIGSDNVEEDVKKIDGLFMGIKSIVWFVGIGSLIAGIIGVGNIMLIIVKDRTKEIGIRKAVGATPTSIVSMILLESVFITTLSGYLGLLTSIGIVYLMNQATGPDVPYFANPQVHLGVGIASVVILALAGALTGLIPALQASRINPVEALKDE